MKKKTLASGVDATKAVKQLFPLFEEKLKRIDLCWFSHAWLNPEWEPGDNAGTLFYETNAKYSFYENILMLIINEIYQEVRNYKRQYQIIPRPTADGFALDVQISADINPEYKAEVNLKRANAENLFLLYSKLSEITGVFNCKITGENITFRFNGQQFTVNKPAQGLVLGSTKNKRRIK